MNRFVFLFASMFAVLASPAFAASEPIPLWPKGAPGPKIDLPPEADATKPDDNQVAGKPLIRLGNVSDPTITIYPAPKDQNTGAAVVVCPGGGYSILAMDLEGTEVCEWLNSLGVTGVLLKYRVPRRPGDEQNLAPLQDAQRALGFIRHHASDYGIDPKRIGVLGFSAGGNLAAKLANQFDERLYEKVDDADEASCRPDFAILIYPAYLTKKENPEDLNSGLPVSGMTPPTFMVMAQDDPVKVENVIYYYAALQKSKVPAELHIYPTGGHGYGLRPTDLDVTRWSDRAADWMKSQGLLRQPTQ
ncbi:MAG: alpha/beta hydrolase [Chthoniobacteraceae bacterium]